jgi:hypothetical protein
MGNFPSLNNTDEPALLSNVEAVQNQINLLTPANQLISGGVIYSGTGLIYDVSALSYRIQGVVYPAIASQVTLPPADPTNPRIDVIYVDDAGLTGSISGTPAISPAKPTLDNATQLELTFVTVLAGATTPTISIESIYFENAGTPTEWGGTTNGSVNFASVTDPFPPSTVSVETTSVLANGDWIKFTPIAPYTINGGVLDFQMKAKVNMSVPQGAVRVGFYNSGALVGNSVELGGSASPTFGFLGSNVVDYQLVAIDMSAFGLLPSTVEEVRIFRSGGGSVADFFLDNIEIQEIPTIAPSILTVGDSIAGGTANSVLYEDVNNTLAEVPTGTNTQVLTLVAGVPTWVNAGGGGGAWQPNSIPLGSLLTSGATFFLNGSAGVILSFSGVADDSAFFNDSLNKSGSTYDGSDLRLRLHYRISLNGTVGDTVGWLVSYKFSGDGTNSNIAPALISQQNVDVSAELQDIDFTTDLGIMTGLAGADTIFVTLTRNSSGAGADTFGGSAEIVSLEWVKV